MDFKATVLSSPSLTKALNSCHVTGRVFVAAAVAVGHFNFFLLPVSGISCLLFRLILGRPVRFLDRPVRCW